MVGSDPFGLIGQVLDGQFRVEEHVGEGGFSVVFRGTHLGLHEPIAIKCLKLPGALSSALVESFVRRFRDESRIQYKLSQGNLDIARALASGTVIAPATSAILPYTVLEWLEGRSLATEFEERRARKLTGRSPREVVALLDSAALAVAFAHAQGVVHRDLNPGNLFLARTPVGVRLKVLDFGVAKIMTDAAIAMGPSARTVGNVRIFAPAYGAPEQFDEGAGTIGPWTDVYALALVFLEALTDRTVMTGEHVGEFALKALSAHDRPTPRGLGAAVGDAVENLVARALALAPEARPRDAGDFWGALKNAISSDEASGSAPHAQLVHREPEPAPATLRLDTPVAPGAAPAIEIGCPSAAPPAMARAYAGTLRLPHSPRSGSEALAATPGPAFVNPATTLRLSSSAPPPPVVARGSEPAPAHPTPVPPTVASVPAEASVRGGRAWVWTLALVALVALTGTVWLAVSRGHPDPTPAAVSPPG